MNLIKLPWVKALIFSTLAVLVLLVLQVMTVVIPNAFFFLGAIVALLILAIIFYHCSANCLQKYFLVSAIALLIYLVVLSFFVGDGILVLSLIPLWIGIFLILNLLFSFLGCKK